jgi:hypothetical protein
MCQVTFLKVTKIRGGKAEMSDGRTVLLGPLAGIRKGDYLEVYADLAVAKADPGEIQSRVASDVKYLKGRLS